MKINLTTIAQQKIPEESRDAMRLAVQRALAALPASTVPRHEGEYLAWQGIEAALGVAFRLGMAHGIRVANCPEDRDFVNHSILDQLGVDSKGGVE